MQPEEDSVGSAHADQTQREHRRPASNYTPNREDDPGDAKREHQHREALGLRRCVHDDACQRRHRPQCSAYADANLPNRWYALTSSRAAASDGSSSHTATGMPASAKRSRSASRRSRQSRTASNSSSFGSGGTSPETPR